MKNIITIMVGQHRLLSSQVKKIAVELQDDEINFELIYNDLMKFKNSLEEHISLEMKDFYPPLLKKMKLKGVDTSKTELFIKEMDEIENIVIGFLNKYTSIKLISNGYDLFQSEFDDIAESLALRIESEEAGVYSYWGLF